MNYAPNKLSQILFAIGWFAVGMVIAYLVGLIVMLAAGPGISMDLFQVVVYPVMFIPVLTYVSYASRKNSTWGRPVPFDRPVGGVRKGILLGLAVCLATFCAGFIGDAAGTLLPPLSEEMKIAMSALTEGNVLYNILSACIMAPLLEEWLCRGVIERGLLSCERGNGRTGYSPALAIFISAAAFALIHRNIWQGVPAFLFGLLFGYVYYRTGSLKLTVLMHCFNNSMSVVIAQTDILSDAESWKDVMLEEMFWAVVVASAIEVALTMIVVHKAGNGRFWTDKQ